jgi:hypothetical protein
LSFMSSSFYRYVPLAQAGEGRAAAFIDIS